MEQPIRATISNGYLIRMGLVALFSLGLAGWCIYDGTVTYPNQRVRALKFRELHDASASEADFVEKWEAAATENDWPLSDPGKPKNKWDITNQFIMAGGVAPFGLVFLFLLVRSRGRWIEADEKGLTTSWGPACSYDDIVTLDKKKWRNKGIAYVNYEADGGTRKIVLDDCKYDRYGTEDILKHVETEIDLEQIVNGPPQSLTEEEATGEAEESQPSNDPENDDENRSPPIEAPA